MATFSEYTMKLSCLVLSLFLPSLLASTLLRKSSNHQPLSISQDAQELAGEGEKARDCDLSDILCQTVITGDKYPCWWLKTGLGTRDNCCDKGTMFLGQTVVAC